MHVAYKTKIFTGDGQTFIRPFILNIPCCSVTGSSRVAESYAPWGSGGAAFYLFTEAVKNSPTCKVLLDQYCTMWGTGLVAEMAREASGTSVVNLCKFIGGLTPAVGQAIRMVFNNDSYIKITIASYSTANLTTTASFTFAFYDSANHLLGSFTSGERYDQQVVNQDTHYATLSYFPFAFPNEEGVYEDTHVRLAIGASSYTMAAINANRVVSSGGDVTWPLVGPAAGISTYLYTPYQTDIDISAMVNGLEPFDENDPYPDIPNSLPSGPSNPTGIPTSDSISIPSLPTVSLLNTGFVSLFNPSMADIKNLADYMWNNNAFDLTNFKKIFANPMDCILGLNMVPVTVPASGSASINIGNLTTSVSMPLAASQWQELDCGTLDIGLPLGSYMDYAPNTKYSIYLPYIGIQELSTDDVAGKQLTLKYHVDLMSCACIAYLKCGDSVLYQFAGSCGYPIPVTENSWNNLYKAIAELAVGVGGAVATGGMSAGGLMNGAIDLIQGLKPEVHRSGAIGSAAGLMSIQTPFLIIEIPNVCKPDKQYHYLGYPSFVTKKLNDITGYAEFENILIEGVPCTEEEQTMIKNLCKGGIFL